MVARSLALLVVVACSGKPRSGGDDATPTPRADAASADAAGSAAPAGKGELAVRVEWKKLPGTLRASPGRTPCNTPRAPQVAPTTTWGIPDALVVVEGAPSPAEARVVLADCAFSPRVAAATTLVVESAALVPARVSLAKWGTLAKLDALAAGDARVIQLPIAGHAVSIALDAGGVYQLATDASPPEVAWIIAGPAFVTDAAGQITTELASGAHAVTAWLPPRAGQPAKLVTKPATINANAATELVVDLAAP